MVTAEFKQTAKAIREAIERSCRILVISHEQCGDATGSLLAFGEVLDNWRKRHTLFSPVPISASFRFLPGWERIVSDSTEIDFNDYDLVVCLDAGGLEKTGLKERLESIIEQKLLPVINIDHHFTNNGYGHLNLVVKTAAATTEVLHNLFKEWEVPLTRPLAAYLLTGLVTDTGNFTNGATSASALAVASDLLRSGAPYRVIIEQSLAADATLAKLKLWGKILSRLFVDEDRGLLVAVVTAADLKEAGVNDTEELEDLSNFLSGNAAYHSLNLKGVLVLKDLGDGQVKGSLRTIRDDFDVSELAKSLGGGGHRRAAGFSLPGKLVAQNNNWSIMGL